MSSRSRDTGKDADLSGSCFGPSIRRRIVDEMLRSVRKNGSVNGEDHDNAEPPTDVWSVLIMDAFTTKIVSSVVRMSEILDDGITLVEDINKNREPFPRMNGIYFIEPKVAAVKQLISDFKVRLK